MKKRLGNRLVWAVVVMGLASLLAGCESSTSTDGVADYFDGNPVVIDPAPVNPDARMRLMPGTATLETDGDTLIIRVDGGHPPYAWTVSDVSKGSVTEVGSASSAYQRSDAGDNVVICTDSRGQTVLAALDQP